MKYIVLSIALNILLASSCVSDSAYKKLENEKNILESRLKSNADKLDELSTKYDTLLDKIKKDEEIALKKQNERKTTVSENQNNNYPYVSEEEAMKYINDNYSFYQKDMLFRNVQLRRLSNNSFRVSLEECTKKGNFSNNDFFWSANVKTLKISGNGKYSFEYSNY